MVDREQQGEEEASPFSLLQLSLSPLLAEPVRELAGRRHVSSIPAQCHTVEH